jgi:Co/Zn/Cd efflux system component
MGLGVLAYTIYRTQVLQTPEAGLMGGFGIGALLINVIAVIILLPHRKGDANVRAVWLFSRNDALGNILVIIAAGFVFLTNTSWPDLIAAGVIAVLFLQSSWSIIKDARNDLKKSNS